MRETTLSVKIYQQEEEKQDINFFLNKKEVNDLVLLVSFT
jgi:hypothetical protein